MPMLENRKFRFLIFFCALCLLIAAVGGFLLFERQLCMGIPVVSQDSLGAYDHDDSISLAHLRFNGEPIAADISTNTIYISQSPEELIHYSTLQGTLTSEHPKQHLVFVRSAALEDIPAAVGSGTPLSLTIKEGDRCRTVNVVVTTLPVLNINGKETHTNEEGRSVFSGTATLWAGFDPALDSYSTVSSDLQWHIRGNSTASERKTSWKLSYKAKNGENKNVELLGQGKDDDWILNSLTMDDTRIKEKLFMDLWNAIAAQTDYNYKMSSGEYVEVVINGEYLGLFLLQRRLDAKYLDLDEEDVLLKVTSYQAASAQEAYEFVTPPVNKSQIYAIMQDVFERKDASGFHLGNVIDVNLMLQLASARDNFSLKNMYIVLNKTDHGYHQFLVPWDTDQSFGVVWKTDIGFCYDYQQSLGEFTTRMETAALKKLHPEYQQSAIERWHFLRQSTLSESSMLYCIDSIYEQLIQSGALARDTAKWSNRYGGEDTVGSLKDFIHDRLLFLDDRYQ